MKFFSIISLATILISTVVGMDDREAAIARSQDTGEGIRLERRASCSYSTTCKGYGWSPGLHCGDGSFGCAKGHVYQIGSATNVCDFGTRKSCQSCGGLACT